MEKNREKRKRPRVGSLESVQKLIGKKVSVKQEAFYSEALREMQKETQIVGTLLFVGRNEILGFNQATVGRTPVRISSWNDVSLFQD